MSRVCQVTGKKPMKGHHVSHPNNKTIRTFEPNLHYRRFWVESQSRWVRLRVSTAGLRRIDKLGVEAVLAEIKPHNKEQAPQAGQARDQEIRSQGPQARPLQGREAEVAQLPPKLYWMPSMRV